ncbi:hypothetical protein NEDG_01237 [Nematocida displodere]|uniref:RING-type domain-containing protein n=1 Tax=Nematocida displodere TaxID=1805483 RepID=A0A177EBA8_9MICR|nr:hypothetical protein NEDG_01237 [Nematocida displodere]
MPFPKPGPRALLALLFAVLGSCGRELLYNTSPELVRPYELFQKSGTDLDLETHGHFQWRFMPKQQGTKTLLLSQCALEEMSDLRHVRCTFTTLKIHGSFDSAEAENEVRKLHGLFQAFAIVSADCLVIENILLESPPQTQTQTRTPTQTPTHPDPTHPDPIHPNPTQVHRLAIGTLRLVNMTACAMETFFGLSTMEHCILCLKIDCPVDAQSLSFIDQVACRNLLDLEVTGLRRSFALDCAVLREGRVLRCLVVRTALPDAAAQDAAPPQVSLSGDIVHAITSRAWLGMELPLQTWKDLPKSDQEALQVQNLAIACPPNSKLGTVRTNPDPTQPGWLDFLQPRGNRHVQSLALAAKYIPSSYTVRTIYELLKWATMSFCELQHIDLQMKLKPYQLETIRLMEFYLPADPQVQTVLIGGARCLLFRPDVVPGSFIFYVPISKWPAWESGTLREEFCEAYRGLKTDKDLHCSEKLNLDLSTILKEVDPDMACPVCLESFSALSQPAQSPASPETSQSHPQTNPIPNPTPNPIPNTPEHMCIIDHSGHIVCNRCLARLTQTKPANAQHLNCPLCREAIHQPEHTYILEEGLSGASKLSRYSPRLITVYTNTIYSVELVCDPAQPAQI